MQRRRANIKSHYALNVKCFNAGLPIGLTRVSDPECFGRIRIFLSDTGILVGSGSGCFGLVRLLWSDPDPGVLVGSGSVILIKFGPGSGFIIKLLRNRKFPYI